MTDNEINKKLAEVMGYRFDVLPTNEILAVKPDNLGNPFYLDYQDSDIFYECLEWLLDNGCIELWDGLLLDYMYVDKNKKGSDAFMCVSVREIHITERNRKRAIALARIKAGEV